MRRSASIAVAPVPGGVRHALDHARTLAGSGADEAAKGAYLEMLRRDPTQRAALLELGALCEASGHRSAARTAYAQAVRCHPDDPTARVGLGNLLSEDDDLAGACAQYRAALAADPVFPQAHQGLARALSALGDPGAEAHWQQGFAGHAVSRRRYRGTGPGVPLLVLVAARGGNVPTRHWIDDRRFAVTAVCADFHAPGEALPPHDLVVNAIGDADLCAAALIRAEAMLAGGTVPVINPPGRVRATGRAEMAQRLATIPGVIAPRMRVLPRAALATAEGLAFPLLLRAPGFHTGRHFVRVDSHGALADAAAGLPGEEVLAIAYHDARGPDGMARKYRAMFIDGRVYPLHLAIAADWKVHYFTAAMAERTAYREEERRFLDDMPGVLGTRAMAALEAIAAMLGLGYGGIDFALSADGSLLVFEANATMVVNPPDPDPIWDYRRPAVAAVLAAAGGMLARAAGMGG
ncbi:MAG TPA: tetratricopeptide repeat protein [Acetobacteraceae bacterium]|nr:tetratricopeptide repeat protein [Acetobacteraceae bacterium]